MSQKYVSLEGISRRYPAPNGRSTTVFEDVWLPLQKGEFVCVIGHSGCGKTSILNILAGLETRRTAWFLSMTRRSPARASTAR